MKTKKIVGTFILILHFSLFAGVPIPRTHNPSLPYFMEQINFQTILLNVYGENISGVIPNQYSDLNWNPAFILQGNENSAYIDFNYQSPNISNYGNYYSSSSEAVSPQWYGNTYITSLQLNPLYNFALIQKISDKISIGIINRSLFDYGPLRSSSNSYSYSRSSSSVSSEYDKSAYDALELKTVEVEENQQSIWGTQTEFTLGYDFSSKIDIGLKFGHYIFRQMGELNDSRYAKQPHSFIDEYNKEDLTIDGNQYEIGAGLIYHLDDKTNLGIYASIMNGNSLENNVSLDNSDSWFEVPTDTNYYSINEYDLASNYSFSSNGSSPFLSLTFQKELSENLEFRSFFSYRNINKEITSYTSAKDTSYSDRTYDSYSYDTGGYYFRERETSRSRRSSLDGGGNEIMENYKWFASLIYKTENKWSAFAAIMIQMETKEVDLSEKSTYYNDYNTQYFYYDPSTRNQLESYIKNYKYNYDYTRWSAIIPVGIKAHIYKGFSLLIGTDLQFELIKTKESGNLIYTKRISRITENGIISQEDIEENRPEAYSSDNPMRFNKTSIIHLGAFYEHSSGLKLYVKTVGDIFNKSFWTFGLEYVY